MRINGFDEYEFFILAFSLPTHKLQVRYNVYKHVRPLTLSHFILIIHKDFSSCYKLISSCLAADHNEIVWSNHSLGNICTAILEAVTRQTETENHVNVNLKALIILKFTIPLGLIIPRYFLSSKGIMTGFAKGSIA